MKRRIIKEKWNSCLEIVTKSEMNNTLFIKGRK